MLASCREEEYRDGRKAVELAKAAVEAEKKPPVFFLATLAAAYAEVGDFGEAIGWQERALAVPGYQEDEEYRRRLKLYRMKMPFRQE